MGSGVELRKEESFGGKAARTKIKEYNKSQAAEGIYKKVFWLIMRSTQTTGKAGVWVQTAWQGQARLHPAPHHGREACLNSRLFLCGMCIY